MEQNNNNPNNMKAVLVSIIIPTYGIPKYLMDSIESIRNQTIDQWELIVVDDNNPNTEARQRTEECLLKYRNDVRIIYLQHEKNKNGSAARNTGIRRARGRYIAFLDSDDLYFPTRLEECLAAIAIQDQVIAGVYTGCEFRRNGRTYRRYTDVKAGNFLTETLACTFSFCTGSNIFMRSDVVRELMFDESFARHQDYEFLVRYFQKYDLAAIPKVLVIKNNDNVNLPKTERIISIKEQYLSKYDYMLREMNQSSFDYVYFSQYMEIAESALENKKLKLANQYYKKAKGKGKVSVKKKCRLLAIFIRSYLRRSNY